jgi:16S rRNA (guanine966-N2)-methyltransferase
MRIVSGTLKGRRFSPPPSFKARPTTDQARESLFNILNNYINFEEQDVLDLFGGTGAISYECASRGCRSIVCIEKKYSHYKFIIETTSSLDLSTQIKVLKTDVFKLLHQPQNKYSLIFADPPFNLPQLPNIPSLVMKSEILNKNGLFILEHGPDYAFDDSPFFWQSRKYGKVNFSFFKY